MDMQRIASWLEPRLACAAALHAQPSSPHTEDPATGPLRLGIDLGTSDVVSMVVDADNTPVAVRLDWADVVRDGIVWDFAGAVRIVREQYRSLQQQLGQALPLAAITSFPPGTDARISANVIDAAGIVVRAVIDEPSAVADLLQPDNAAIIDIGGGTTGVAIMKAGEIIYSSDEPTGGHHVTLTLAGNQGISLEAAETLKKSGSEDVWPAVKPVFENMAHLAQRHLDAHAVDTLYLSGGSCMQPGVAALFASIFPQMTVVLPANALFLTPLAIAAHQPRET